MTQLKCAIAALVVLLFATQAAADIKPPYQWGGNGGDGWDDWYGNLCKNVNKHELGGASIPCRIDHASFEKHYASAHDDSNPHNYCMTGLNAMTMQMAGGGMEDVYNTPAVREEFKSKVKEISCRFVEGNVVPSVTLQNGTLVFNITNGEDGAHQVGHGYKWVSDSFKKLFPAFLKRWSELNGD